MAAARMIAGRVAVPEAGGLSCLPVSPPASAAAVGMWWAWEARCAVAARPGPFHIFFGGSFNTCSWAGRPAQMSHGVVGGGCAC